MVDRTTMVRFANMVQGAIMLHHVMDRTRMMTMNVAVMVDLAMVQVMNRMDHHIVASGRRTAVVIVDGQAHGECAIVRIGMRRVL